MKAPEIILIALFITVAVLTTSKSSAQQITEGEKIYLLKPDNFGIGVPLGATPSQFHTVFGEPTKSETITDDINEESHQTLSYGSCHAYFVKTSMDSDYHLVGFKLRDSSIGFGEKGKYMFKINDRLQEIKWPVGHPQHPKVMTWSLGGIKFAAEVITQENSTLFIDKPVTYNGEATDANIYFEFDGLTLKEITIPSIR